MSYLIQPTRPYSVTVNGVNVTQELVEFVCSDSSAFKNGLIQTKGTLILAAPFDESGNEDYNRNSFRRGHEVVVEIEYSDGTTERHPRGLLYVMGVQYVPEDEVLEIEVGCKLSMIKLVDDPDEVLALVPIPLDPSQRTMEGASGSFLSDGKFLWQDNTGNLVVSEMFPEGINPISNGKFAVVRGETALSVEPLQGVGPIPDQIELTYKVPSGTVGGDEQGRQDIVETTSYYYLRYPGITYVRTSGIISIDGDTSYKDECWKLGTVTVHYPSQPGTTNACGTSPSRTNNTYSYQQAFEHNCLSCYTSTESVQYVNAIRTETQTTTYNGPAGQVSRVVAETVGPALELNNQYYADKYAYCQATYASTCDPNGSCPLYGLEDAVLGRTITRYRYGDANELVRTVVDTYRPVISAMKPVDWRSGVVGSVPQDFNNNIDTSKMFLFSRVVTTTGQEGNTNVMTTETWTSVTSRGGGTRNLDRNSIDARNGIKTKQVRRSSTTTTIDISPDRVNAPETATKDKKTTLTLSVGGGYTGGDNGPYSIKDDIPVSLLFDTSSERRAVLNRYSDYIVRFTEGDARGLSIVEGLRKSIGSNWTPNQAFWYYDDLQGQLMSFRSDAHTWGISSEGCIVGMSGIWMDDHNGSVSTPGNLSGNATPVIPPDPVTPTPPPVPPTGGGSDDPDVTNDGATNKKYIFNIDIDFRFEATYTPLGADGIVKNPPTPEYANVQLHFIPVVTGVLTQPGGAIRPVGSGSMPSDFDGFIFTDPGLVIDADLFA